MRRCLHLAELGRANVSPNPMVGAVIVVENKIIGEGYHEKFGQAHAEVNAISQVLEKKRNGIELLKHSSLFVSLEPCSHFGKTPPCVDLILKYQIPIVYIACLDPFSKVNGSGVKRLQDAGVQVHVGLLDSESIELNKRFFTYHQKQRPYIILKFAESKNGCMASENGEPIQISNQLSSKLTHRWRSEETAILVGANTVKMDNPSLTTRNWTGKNPIRIIIDKNLSLSTENEVFNQLVKTLVFTEKIKIDKTNLQYLTIDWNLYPLQFILFQLYLFEISSVIIEGGAKTLSWFIQQNLWDEARVITSSNSLTSEIKSPIFDGFPINKYKLGSDTITIYTPKNQ